ncbi:MAG: DUF739 family protein [Clostridiales bacterium]|jgi:plasmid maintenance system antidote protein VapI|nr:DUF739 family protein [Clostridiales bacterium]
MSNTYSKLRGRIVEVYGSMDKFAEVLNITRTTVSNKINNKSKFSRDDIILWASALKISQEDIPSYFFTE